MVNYKRQWMQWAGVAGSCMMWLTACQQGQEAAPMTGGGKYETMVVTTADKELTTAYSATIRGRQDVNIMPQVSGCIERMPVTEGQTVRQGQVLFVIDQVPYTSALKTAEANVKVAQSALATAKLNYDSNKALYAKNVVSEYTLKTAENAYLTAEAQLAQAEAQAVNARNNLSYTEVKSPANGVVGTLPYRVGALVGPSMAQPLTTVSDNGQMYVYFSMTEDQLLALTRQYGSMDEALAHMPAVQLQLKDRSIYEESGKIESVSGVIDRTTGTVTARAVFDNRGGLLHSGASGNVILPTTYKDCIVIPQAATVQMQDKTLVYKVEAGKAVSALITVAAINDGKDYVVLSGLQKGEEIVATGAGLVREGTQVK